MRFLSITLMIIYSTLPLTGQTAETTGFERYTINVPDTVSAPHVSRLSFERLLSSYQWQLNHRTYFESDRWFLSASEQFRSTLIQTDRKFIKDQQELRFLGGYRVDKRFDVRVTGSSLFLSDNQITGLNDAAINGVHAGVGYRPTENVTIAPFLGYMIDRQSERIDRGISFLGRLTGNEIEIAQTMFNVDGQYSLQRVDPRTTASHHLIVHADRQFDDQTYMNIRTYYSYTRREFYFAADEATQDAYNVFMNIDQRFDRRIGAAGDINYRLRGNIIGQFSTAMDWRTVTRGYFYQPTVPPSSYLFNTAVDDFELNLRLALNYRFGTRYSGVTHFSYSERSEEHSLGSVDPDIPPTFVDNRAESEFIKNNVAQRTSLATHGTLRLATGHRLTYAGSTSILRYDTPSPQNFDDRDELRILFFIGTSHDLNRYVTLDIAMDALVTHVVYLRAQRSANNNWNRVLRLTPAVTYRPTDRFSTTNAFEVLANYTVYDFEDMVSDLRSLSYRQIGWIDSTTVSFADQWQFRFFSHYRRYERGELRWGTFSERPLQSFEELTIIASIRYDFRPDRIAFAGGIRYFNRSRYQYVQRDREFESKIRNAGPTCSVYWNIDRRLEVTVNGWYELQFRDSQHINTIPNLSVEIQARL
jgi:hypothetical protein